jgi:2-polyprenyl-6-methoxyphenol hydroxylase-like FAD-dependent oxidoreductase
MAKHTETEVLVVGAGPVGLFAALSLIERGVAVQIADEEFRTAAHSYALALHPRSLQLCHDLGLADALLARGYRVETVAFYEGAERCGEMKLSALSDRFPFVLVLPQSELEGLLEQRLRKLGVRVQWNRRVRSLEVKEASVSATIDKLARASCGYAVATTEWVTQKTVHTDAAFVVGADGHRSIVRRTLGAEYESAGSSDSYAVFEFHTDADLAGEVRIVFAGGTTSVLWPLPGGRCRWSFQQPEGREGDESRAKHRLTVPIGRQVFAHLSGKELKALIRERAPWFEGEIQQLDWSMAVRFDRRLASSFGQGRLWLAGDAAHLTGPVGAQSLNMGLREASDLAGRLTRILKEAAPPTSLADYSDAYLQQWRQLLGTTEGLAPTDASEDWAKGRCADLLPCIPATGEHLAELASQVGLALPSSER